MSGAVSGRGRKRFKREQSAERQVEERQRREGGGHCRNRLERLATIMTITCFHPTVSCVAPPSPPAVAEARLPHFFLCIPFPSALLTMQTAVIARADLSVCLSVTFPCFVQTNEGTIVWSSVSGRTIILVSGEVKFIRIFTGRSPPATGREVVKVKRPHIASENLTNNEPYLRNGAR